VKEKGVDTVIFDDDLTPAQIKNLEKIMQAKIIDRSNLILDIFARRAKTREAKTQVELAQLQYLLPRLTRRWTHLSRQVGGIGTRGVGETQLEIDRRIIKKRIIKLSRELQKIELGRSERRKGRENIFKVALIGYTNAGKTSLFNVFAEAHGFVEDRLFATLDTLVRKCQLSRGGDILLIDTVGFIRKLPIHLVASFRSTLEEVVVADLLLEVVDLNHERYEDHLRITESVKGDLGIIDKPCLIVFNKIDLVRSAILERAKRLYPDALFVSATSKRNFDDIDGAISDIINRRKMEIELCLKPKAEDIVAFMHQKGEIVERSYEDGYIRIKFKSTRDNIQKVCHLAEIKGALI
jgi:GTP-binding protein HflX